jgi:hypothetical protein
LNDADIMEKLDKPGAGVSTPLRLFLTYYMKPFVAAKSDWDENNRVFERRAGKVLALVAGLSDEQMNRRMLVKPVAGLEDSSRYWSASMVLEHLVIVGESIKGLTAALSQGIVPDTKVDTARAKPTGQYTPEHNLSAFTHFAKNLLPDTNRSVKDRASKATLQHPWFGPFTAHEWHWLQAVHLSIHLKQLRQIVAGLKA